MAKVNIKEVMNAMPFEQIAGHCKCCKQYSYCVQPFNRDCGVLQSIVKNAAEGMGYDASWEDDEDVVPEDEKARLLEEKPVDMVAMQKRIQAMLLRARQEIVETQTLTASAMVCVVDALFYLVEMSGHVPEAIPAPYVMRTDSTDDIGVCKTTGNYCTGCNPGPCEHRK